MVRYFLSLLACVLLAHHASAQGPNASLVGFKVYGEPPALPRIVFILDYTMYPPTTVNQIVTNIEVKYIGVWIPVQSFVSLPNPTSPYYPGSYTFSKNTQYRAQSLLHLSNAGTYYTNYWEFSMIDP